jgi:hypothetical protein
LHSKRKQQRLVVRKSHAVRLAGVALDLGDESILVFGAGIEAAVAMKHSVHDSSSRP